MKTAGITPVSVRGNIALQFGSGVGVRMERRYSRDISSSFDGKGVPKKEEKTGSDTVSLLFQRENAVSLFSSVCRFLEFLTCILNEQSNDVFAKGHRNRVEETIATPSHVHVYN